MSNVHTLRTPPRAARGHAGDGAGFTVGGDRGSTVGGDRGSTVGGDGGSTVGGDRGGTGGMGGQGTREADDRRAMAWLTRLLDAPPAEHAALLALLQAEPPALAERVRRLWRASQSAEGTLGVQSSVAMAVQAAATDLHAGLVLGAHRLVKPIGHGGMAEVWLAERTDGVAQRAAIKFPALALAPAQAERFTRERNVLGLLTHPHIARLYDAGVSASGRPYITMEYVDGLPLQQACSTRQWGVRQRLEIFLQVLHAVAFAHQRLVVHRDLKPSNIWVDQHAQVRLLDFGIAKLLDDGGAGQADMTRDIACALTPRYAAPEQIEGGAITTATDVYALGGVLYELLTGVAPHARARTLPPASRNAAPGAPACAPADADAPVSTTAGAPTPAGSSVVAELLAALHLQPPLPSRAAPAAQRRELQGDIDTVVMKALRKRPEERYASAQHFADDVRRVLAHQPIAARRPSLLHRLHLLWQRNRALSAAGAIGAAAALVLTVMLVQQQAQTAKETARSDAVRSFMLDMFQDALPAAGQTQVSAPLLAQIENAVGRARSRFADDAPVRAQLLAELSMVLRNLDRQTQAMALMTEADATLEHSGHAQTPLGYLTRASLGSLMTAADAPGTRAAARRLLDDVIAHCPAADKRCHKPRAYAFGGLVDLAARQAMHDEAIRAAQAAVESSRAGFGPTDVETALALRRLAVQFRNGGRVADAQAAIAQAAALAASAPDLRARDQFDLQNTQGLIALDMGRYAEARATLGRLLPLTSAPDRRAQLQRLIARTWLAEGAFERADAAAREAVRDAIIADDDWEKSLAQQALASARSGLGDHAGAAELIAQVQQSLADQGLPAHGIERRRAQRVAAEIAWAGGDAHTARQSTLALLQAHAARATRAPVARTPEDALLMDFHAVLAREAGRFDEARRWHAEAASVFSQTLPPSHPSILRNRALTALLHRAAREASQPIALGDASVEQARAIDAFSRTLPSESAWPRWLQASSPAWRRAFL